MKQWLIVVVEAVVKFKPEESLGLNGISTHDLCDTGAVLHQLSYYSPEVETEKPFKRKRKGNDLDLKVLCVFWWDHHCRVAHRQNHVVRKFAHAHIAILASSYSDDVVSIEVKK